MLSGIFAVRLTRETTLRVIADAVMINVSVLVALALRFFYLLAFELTAETVSVYTQTFWNYLGYYRNSAWALTLICLVMFSASGFYTYGRGYRGRYKVLIIVQAVSFSFLIFGFLSYFLGGLLQLPRGALILAWAVSVISLLGARFWATIWAQVVHSEQDKNRHSIERTVDHVLVIGGAGYIGSALLPKLLRAGYRVRLLDLLLYGTEPIQEFLSHPNLEVVRADLRQVDKIVEAMQNVDAVVHLGAIVGDLACALDEELTIEVNLMATRMIAEVAKGSGVGRFIFASTCSVYGASNDTLNERSGLNPMSLYARSKIASERVLARMADDNFAPTFLRFGTIYGLSGRTRFDLVVNLLTAKAVVDGQITIFGGDQWRPFVHVDDAALAIFQVLEAPVRSVRGEVFNVGSNEQNYTISQIGEIIHRIVPAAELINMGSDTDRRNYRVDFNKIYNAISFVPVWTVESGVRQVIEAIETGHVTDYRAVKYSTVKFLSEEAISHLMRRENGWARELINETSLGVEVTAAADSVMVPISR